MCLRVACVRVRVCCHSVEGCLTFFVLVLLLPGLFGGFVGVCCGSITKISTGTAILRLVEEGKIKLDDTIPQ